MADTGNAGQGQEPAAQSTQTGQESTGQQSAGTPQQQGTGQEPGQAQQGQQGAGEGQPDLSAIADPNLRAWVEAQARQAKEAREEAARYRTERNTLQEQVTQHQRANETDQQRAEREAQEHQQKLEQLERENRELKLGGQWSEAAAKARALDPKALLSLIGGPDLIQMGEDGKATNLAALLDKAKTDYPWAFARAAGGADAGEGGQGPSAQGGMNDFIRNGGRTPRRA